MIKELLAEDVMNTDPLTLSADQSVTEAARQFVERGTDSAPVLEGRRVIGIVSDSDLIMQDVRLHFPTYYQFLEGYISFGLHRFEKELRKAVAATVKDVMTTDVVTVARSSTVQEVATLMENKHFHAVPVVEDSGEMVGVVSKFDLVKALARG